MFRQILNTTRVTRRSSRLSYCCRRSSSNSLASPKSSASSASLSQSPTFPASRLTSTFTSGPSSSRNSTLASLGSNRHRQRYEYGDRRYSSGMTANAPTRTLNFAEGPLVWVDCEMTGLDPQRDKILEIAVLITDGDLQLIDEGIEFVIKTDQEVLNGMNEWCIQQHGKSGLTQACLNSPHTFEYVKESVLQYIKARIPRERTGVLAGNTVHMDKAFLDVHMPEITEWLHYRIVDVSSIKELCRRWYPDKIKKGPGKPSGHRALDDIQGSIRELTWYRENIFIPSSNEDQDAKSGLQN